jgi:hypothetical protein
MIVEFVRGVRDEAAAAGKQLPPRVKILKEYLGYRIHGLGFES